jgi:hypothetical protein
MTDTSMIQQVDDYPFHQSAKTFSEPIVDDVRWFDRYWHMTGDVERGICLITGFGTYPNAKRIDAYAMLSDGKRQWSLRVGRERDPDPMKIDTHGLAFELAEAMKSWNLRLDGYEELAFDLRFDSRFPPNYLPPLYVERDGHVIMEMGHYAQGGELTGSLQVGQEQISVDGWAAQRDHSWGRRPPSGKVASGIHVWLPAQVGDREIWVWFRENAAGLRRGLEGLIRHRDGRSWKVEDVKHDIEVVEAVAPHRQLVKAKLELALEGGETMNIEVEPLAPVFIVGGGYIDGPKGVAQGTYEGATMTEWTIDDDGRKEIPLGIIDHFSRVTVDGEVGQGIFELSLGRYEPLGLGAPEER